MRSFALFIAVLVGCGGSADGSDPDASTDGGRDATTDGDRSDADRVDGHIAPDSDADGSDDDEEERLGTDPSDPDSDDDGVQDGQEADIGSDPLDADSDDDGVTDGDEVFLGTDPTRADEACAGASRGATMRRRAVDVVLVIDNSSSMSGEIEAVIDRINEDFASILEREEVDYQVILVSRHGPIGLAANGCDDHGICIEPTLAGAMCDPEGPPSLTERFKQYSVCIDSEDSFQKLAASFDRSPPDWAGGFVSSGYFDAEGDLVGLDDAEDGWSEWLRPGARRVFLEITDDDSDIGDDQFVEWLYSKDARFFGTDEEPSWVFHSIIGIADNDPADEPYGPDEGLVGARCDGSDGTGDDYQRLSIESGGLRFPICNNDSFDNVFSAIAEDVVIGSSVPCRFQTEIEAGAAPPDFDRMLLDYLATPSADPRRLTRAESDACASGDFYVDDRDIVLCPTFCTEASDSPTASLVVHVGCLTTCGDETTEGTEECDDGNEFSEDGCSPGCSLECGDGSRTGTEECDDGDREPGDGCGPDCRFEPF